MVKAVLYTAPKCPYSKLVKEFLRDLNVEVEEKNVLTNPDAFHELKELSGQMAVPVTKIDGDFFVGLDRRAERRLKRKLGV